MKTCLMILLLALLIGRLPAQQPDITPETPVSTETLHQWLNSGNPRLIAWAAYFAQTRQDTQVLNELPAFVERTFSISAGSLNPTVWDNRRAISAVLDTVIQQNIQLPVTTIGVLGDNGFPAQAAILISRLPLTDTRNTLHLWVEYDNAQIANAHLLARVGAMLLALHPDKEIVTRILQDSAEDLEVVVSLSQGVLMGTGEGASCGSNGASSPPVSWPAIYTYDLSENDGGANYLEIVNVDGDRIAAHRFLDNSTGESCHPVAPLDSRTRHRLIAHWLGVEDQAMVWHPQESATIVWTDMAEYLLHLGEIIELHTQQLQATAEALHQRGLLDADGRNATLPNLSIKMECNIEPCPIVPITPNR